MFSIAEGQNLTPPFDFGVRLGLVFVVQSACLSAIAVTCLLLYIAYAAINSRRDALTWSPVSSHIHCYFINLLIADLIQAIGAIMTAKWIADATITQGSLCTAQGIFKQMGDVGVALTSAAITLHTFSVLCFRRHPPPKMAMVFVASIWIFIVLAVSISMAVHRHYYGATQYWCWITEEYTGQRLALEYIWLYISAFMNLVCYAGIALVIKGIITVDGCKIRLHKERKVLKDMMFPSSNEPGTRSSAIAMQMLFYPAVYIITVSPIAIVRWLAFSGKTVPFSATVLASILFSSSGFFNVVLFKFTRPKLLPMRRRSRSRTVSQAALSVTIPVMSGGGYEVPDYLSAGSALPTAYFSVRHPSLSMCPGRDIP